LRKKRKINHLKLRHAAALSKIPKTIKLGSLLKIQDVLG